MTTMLTNCDIIYVTTFMINLTVGTCLSYYMYDKPFGSLGSNLFYRFTDKNRDALKYNDWYKSDF